MYRLGEYERLLGKKLAVLFSSSRVSYDLTYFDEHLSGIPSASLSGDVLLELMNGEVDWEPADVVELDFEDFET